MFSRNTPVFHHCLCAKILYTYVSTPNAVSAGTKHVSKLADVCTCIPVTQRHLLLYQTVFTPFESGCITYTPSCCVQKTQCKWTRYQYQQTKRALHYQEEKIYIIIVIIIITLNIFYTVLTNNIAIVYTS
jgi:hypothetical protein